MRKTHDLVVKNGSYQKDGKDKNRYVNVGGVMETDDGGRFLFISAHVNFAAFPRPEGSESVLVSMFDVVKPADSRKAPPVQEELNDDIKF